MNKVNDMELLRDYAQQNSEAAFAELVGRHLNLVYSAALRHVGIAAQAEDIAQAVFVILARKAGGLRESLILEAWLFETTRLTALNFLRGERRRQLREQEAYMQSILRDSAVDPAWQEMSPLLDEAMMRLGRKEREAIVLRFFKDRSLVEVATALNVNEPAAQMRVIRGLEKLRSYFLKHGISSTTATIAETALANSVQAAPAGLAKTISAVALAEGATISTSTLTLVKGTLKVMAWTKAKTAILAGTSVLLVATATTAWDVWPKDFAEYVETLKQAPPQVRILPTKFSNHGSNNGGAGGELMGFNVSIADMARVACASPSEYNWNPARTIVSANVPPGQYDYIANLPNGSWLALQKEMKKRFGVVGRREVRDENILLLTVKHQDAPGIKPGRPNAYRNSKTLPNGEYSFVNYRMSDLAVSLERTLKVPVVDGTTLAGEFDFTLNWGRKDPAALKQSLLEQLGLALVRTNMPIEMLVVEKVE